MSARRRASPARVAAEARRELARLARPLGSFDLRRYFRAEEDVEFHGVPAHGEDLIQKAVGWLLREAGKTDMARLERYL